jgi:methoxymalonate biosynthesis acyl carrier protein
MSAAVASIHLCRDLIIAMEGTAMTTQYTTLTAEVIQDDVLRLVESRVKSSVRADEELFESGLVSSLLAMELITYLEKSYSVTIDGEDLVADNFRSVEAMTGLVLRLKGLEIPDDGG